MIPLNFEKQYICSRETPDGERSVTKYKNDGKRAKNSSAGCEKTSSGSNITPNINKTDV
jgi:hypothetical protein